MKIKHHEDEDIGAARSLEFRVADWKVGRNTTMANQEIAAPTTQVGGDDPIIPSRQPVKVGDVTPRRKK